MGQWYRYVLYLRADVRDGGHLLDLSKPDINSTPNISKIIPNFAPYLVNYTKQQTCFEDIVNRHYQQPTLGNHPLIFLLHGQERSNTTHGLAARLKQNLEENCLHHGETVHSGLERPTVRLCPFDCDERPGFLLTTIEKNLKDKFAVENLEILHESAFEATTLFYSEVEAKHLSKKLLQDFLNFWNDDGWPEQNHLFIVCLFIDYRPGPLRLLQKMQLTQRLKAKNIDICNMLLPELTPIPREDFTPWYNLMKTYYFSHLSESDWFKVRDELEIRVTELFSDENNKLVSHRKMEYLGPKLSKLLADLCG